MCPLLMNCELCFVNLSGRLFYCPFYLFSVKDVFTVKPDDSTQLVCVLRQTELGGINYAMHAHCLFKMLLASSETKHTYLSLM